MEGGKEGRHREMKGRKKILTHKQKMHAFFGTSKAFIRSLLW